LSALHAQYHMPVVREAFKTIEYALLFIVAMVAYARPGRSPALDRARDHDGARVLERLSDYASARARRLRSAAGWCRELRRARRTKSTRGLARDRHPGALRAQSLAPDGALLAVVAFALVVEVLTFSRAGIAGTIIACVTVTASCGRRAPPACGSAWRRSAPARFSWPWRALGISNDVLSLHEVAQPDDHLGTRGQLWNAARELWRSSPVFGVGAGNFELDLGRVGLPTIRTHANSLYWQSLAEGGVVMLASTLFTFGAILFTFARSQVRRPIVVGVFAATLALALHQFFDDLFFFTKVGTMFWLMIGVAVAELAARQLFVRQRERTFAPPW